MSPSKELKLMNNWISAVRINHYFIEEKAKLAPSIVLASFTLII